jgi:hypothetical protein
MIYRNTRTGQEIFSSLPITGGCWELVDGPKRKSPGRKKAPAKNEDKNGGSGDSR